MFLPGRNVEQERQERQVHFQRIENLCKNLLKNDESYRNACTISVQEIQCGDPNCAPIDTIITLTFTSGGHGMIGLPMEAKDVTIEYIQQMWPPENIVDCWYKGEEADWPPEPEPQELRFKIGNYVLCRVGPTDWTPGQIKQLWYRENQWPEGAYAPYKIHLDDGRDIFAPQDMEQIIRLDPNKQMENEQVLLQQQQQAAAAGGTAATASSSTTTNTNNNTSAAAAAATTSTNS